MLIEAPRGTESSIKCVHVTCMLSLLLKQHLSYEFRKTWNIQQKWYRLYL